MPPSPISLVPQVQDLKLYGGDSVDLQVSVSNGVAAIDLTGAIDAQIRASRIDTEILASFAVDLSEATNGIAYLTLSGSQTAALHDPKSDGVLVESFKGVWDCQWTPQDGEPVTILQGTVESGLDVTRLP
jgi:hypothetical protein